MTCWFYSNILENAGQDVLCTAPGARRGHFYQLGVTGFWLSRDAHSDRNDYPAIGNTEVTLLPGLLNAPRTVMTLEDSVALHSPPPHKVLGPVAHTAVSSLSLKKCKQTLGAPGQRAVDGAPASQGEARPQQARGGCV